LHIEESMQRCWLPVGAGGGRCQNRSDEGGGDVEHG